MALPKFEKDISIISKLSDQPNDTAGSALSAADLKAKFDEGGNELKKFINETLIPYLEGVEAAASLGIKTISGMSEAGNVQEALEALKFAIDNTATGSIPDGSLSGAKLVEKAIGNRELGDKAVELENMGDGSVGGDVVIDKGISGAKLSDGSIENRHLGLLIVDNDNIVDNSIQASGKLKDGSISVNLMAAASVNTRVLADSSVTDAKIVKGAVSNSFSVTLPAASWADGSQTVSASGVTAENTVIVSPEPGAENYAAYTEAAVRCTAQAESTLTFVCETAPQTDVTVNVTVINK